MKKGFTLLELMATVIIIGILSAVALPQYTRAVNKARLAEAVTNMGSLQKAVDMYRVQHRSAGATFLTSTGTRLDVDFKDRLNCNANGCSSAYFTYTANCAEGGNCEVKITPLAGSKWVAYLPTLTATRTSSGLSAGWCRACANGASDTKMCANLASAGFVETCN